MVSDAQIFYSPVKQRLLQQQTDPRRINQSNYSIAFAASTLSPVARTVGSLSNPREAAVVEIVKALVDELVGKSIIDLQERRPLVFDAQAASAFLLQLAVLNHIYTKKGPQKRE